MDELQEMHLGLSQQMQQFATERKQISEAITEVQRRISILDEAMSWGPVAAKPYQEPPLEGNFQTVVAENTEMQWVQQLVKLPPPGTWVG